MEGPDESTRAGVLWSAAVLIPVLCCVAIPLLAVASASAGIALLGVGATLGVLLLAAGLIGLIVTLRRRRTQACRLPVQHR
jgi:hypothetical protein